MSDTLQVRGVASTLPAFAARHHLPLPRVGARIAIGDAFARGGFGAVHPVESIDGAAPGRAVLLKLFTPDALAATGGSQVLTARVAELHRTLETFAVEAWSEALLALPYCLLTAPLPGGIALVALMLDLRALGYCESPFALTADTVAHLSRPAHERIDLALRYAERAALLEQIGFVHSDQNPENVMVTATDVQIIDLDAGVVLHTGDERPLTAGKPDDCMPPEVKRSNPAGPVDLSAYTPEATRWSVASLIGYFLFGAHPGFFLRNISPQTIDAYATAPVAWPEIDQAGPIFTTLEHNRLAYTWMCEQLRALPEAIRELFARLFAAGLDAERRPAAAEWVPALAGLREPPVIDRFELDDTYVLEGSEVTLSWLVRNAERVEIVGHGFQPASGELQLIPDRAAAFELRAEGPYGRRTERTPVVRVVPLPRIETLAVPALPELTRRVRTGLATSPSLGAVEFESPTARPVPRISAMRPDGGPTVPAPVFRLADVLAARPSLHSITRKRRAA